MTPNRLTQLDIVKRAGSDGNTLRVSKVLHETNPLFQDMQFMEASDRNMHLVAKTSHLGDEPDVRNFNAGVGETRATIEPQEERVMLLEKYAKMDNLIYEGPNGKTLRQQENDHIVEKIGQTINRHLIYGGPKDLPDNGNYINGLANRRAKLTTRFDRYHNVIDNKNDDGAANTSVYIVQHGIGYTYGVYPYASSAGIKVENLGRRTEDRSDGTSMEIVSTLFQIGFGLVVEHPASLVRIANVKPWWDSAADDARILQPKHLVEGLNMVDNPSKAVIYVSRHVLTTLSVDAIWKDNVNYNAKDPYGNLLMTFMGVPIRVMDQIIDNEDPVTA